MSDLTERLDGVLKLPLPTEGFDVSVATTTVIAYRSLLSEANEAIKKLTVENEKLEEFHTAVTVDPSVEHLYYGDCHGEPCAAQLIDLICSIYEGQLAIALDVSSYSGYEGEGGVIDAISYNIHSIFKTAKVMDEDHNVSRHKPQAAE